MNKKSAINLLLTLLMSMVGLQVHAKWDLSTKIKVDNLYYYLDEDNHQAQVTSMPSGYYVDPCSIPDNILYNNQIYSVTSIGNQAFAFCDKLTSVTISNSVTSIEYGAFLGCKKLSEITIPNSVTSIGEGAFMGCKELIRIYIPNSVTSIGNNAFADTKLASLIVDVNNPKYDSRDNCDAIIETATNKLIRGCRYTVIPNSVTSIGDGAFKDILSNGGTFSCIIPNSVTSIGNNAFFGCSILTSITIGNSVTSIGDQAFYGCSALTSVTIKSNSIVSTNRNSSNSLKNIFGDQVTKYVIGEGVTSIGDNAFNNCSSMTSMTIPNSVTSIGDMAFNGCSGLTSVSIPDGVTSIGNDAFRNCSGLTSIEIPNSVTTIGDYTFRDCSGLTSVTIPNSVTSIGDDAFSGCSSLVFVVVKWETPINITSEVFTNCTNATLFVPQGCIDAYKTADYWKDFKEIKEASFIVFADENVKAICVANWDKDKNGELHTEEAAAVTDLGTVFKGNTTITSFDELKYFTSLTSISQEAFNGCSHLTSITIPNSVTSIGSHVFYDCKGLTSITIPNSVTSIGDCAFSNCFGLTSFRFPNQLQTIAAHVLSECKVTSIIIPASVKTIEQGAFVSCKQLKDVYCLATDVPTTHDLTFYNLNTQNVTLHVYSESVEKYSSAAVWKTLKQVVALTPDEIAELHKNEEKPYEILVTEDVQAKGRQITFSIDLKNETADLIAYQFDLTLPEGFSLSEDDKGKFLVTKTNRYEDDSHTLTVSKLEGNTYRFVCFSISGKIITGTSGAILNAALTIGESVKEDRYEAKISNITVTKTDETQLNLFNEKFNIIVNFIKGDANGDSEVNVSDIVEIVNYIMNKPSNKFIFSVADMDDDGKVDVTDIVKEVSLIMSSGSNAPKRASVAEMVDNDQLEMTSNDNKTLSLNLQNEGSYVASQFDIVLSAGQTLESIQLNNKRMENHQMTYAKIGDNRYKVVIYSLDNATYNGHNGELLNIMVVGSGDVIVEDILFITAGQMEKRFSSLRGGTTGISVTTKQAEKMNIYSTDGRLVRKQAESTNGLKKGLYIVNGKKIIVR